MLTMIIGTKNGEKPWRGPFSHSVLQVASMVLTPPRPAPTSSRPARANSPSISSPESAIASDAGGDGELEEAVDGA